MVDAKNLIQILTVKNASSMNQQQNGSYKKPEVDLEIDTFEEVEETNGQSNKFNNFKK